MANISEKEGKISLTAKIVQIIFCLVIGWFTIQNQIILESQKTLLTDELKEFTKQTKLTREQVELNIKNSKLIYRPVVGVTNVTKNHSTDSGELEGYLKTKRATFVFKIKNVGQLPAKKLKIKSRAKLGEVMLPYTEREGQEGTILVQTAEVTTSVRISGEHIKKMVEKDTELFVNIEISYQDWEGFESYSNTHNFRIIPINKNPLKFAVQPA